MNIKTNKKISIIGMGAVGSNIAYNLVLKNIADEIALIDINEKLVEAEILDIKHGFSEIGSSNIYFGSYSDIQNSNIIIIAAGRGRKQGETRLDMVKYNIAISKDIIQNIKKYYNNNIIIVVSNPVDILTYKFSENFNLNNNLIFGTGCMLDTSRLISCLADYLSCDIKDIQTYVIGEHGDSQVVVWSKTMICGLPIEEYCKLNNIKFDFQDRINIENKVAKMGADIIAYKNKTHYGISTCVSYLVEKLFKNQYINVSVSTCLNNEYGIKDVALSVPNIIHDNNVRKIIWEDLDCDELKKLRRSAENLKNILKTV